MKTLKGFEALKKNADTATKRKAIEATIKSNPNSPLGLMIIVFPLDEKDSVDIIWKFLELYGGKKDFRLPSWELFYNRHRNKIIFEELLVSNNDRESRYVLLDRYDVEEKYLTNIFNKMKFQEIQVPSDILDRRIKYIIRKQFNILAEKANIRVKGSHGLYAPKKYTAEEQRQAVRDFKTDCMEELEDSGYFITRKDELEGAKVKLKEELKRLIKAYL